MLNNANGASVWTQLVQITALTNWLDSSQQSWGVCQGQVLSAGRGAQQSAVLGGARPPLGGAGRARGSVVRPCRSRNLNSLPGTYTMPPSEDVGQEQIGKRRRETV